MDGVVDKFGRALLVLRLCGPDGSPPRELSVWVDTAFTGELVVSREIIEDLGLPQSGAIRAGLADGAEVVLSTYACRIDWLGSERVVEVIENEGKFPLLGIGLLRDCSLYIDYPVGKMTIE